MKKIGLNNLKIYMILSLLILTMMATSVAGGPPTPNPVTNLHNISYATNYINWTWTDPERAVGRLEVIEIYINETYKGDVPKGVQYYNATGLIADTQYNISTRTIDKDNQTSSVWVNATDRTAPIDNTPPITTITRTGDYKGNNWFASSVDITLSAIDDMSGVQRTEYRLTTSGDWNTYTGPLTINTEGYNQIQYRSIDNANNIELTKSSLVNIDTIYPIITVAGVTNGAIYDASVIPTINVIDTNLVSRSITLNGVPYTSGTEISQNGNYWLNTTAMDVVGHITNSNINFAIDNTHRRGSQTMPVGIVIRYLIYI